MRTMTETLQLLQFGDSVFPVGAFSFSNGLEMAVQHGVVHDRETLQEFVGRSPGSPPPATVSRCSPATGPPPPATSTGSARRRRGRPPAQDQRRDADHVRTDGAQAGRGRRPGSSGSPCSRSGRRRRRRRRRSPIRSRSACSSPNSGSTRRTPSRPTSTARRSMVLSAAVRLMRVDHLDAQSILFAVNETVADDYQRRSPTAGLDDMQTFAPHARRPGRRALSTPTCGCS